MNRIHLFEWEDQVWFPDFLRNNMTDFLRNMILWQGIYDPAVPILKSLIVKTGKDTVVDLCSGAGGGIEDIAKKINEESTIEIRFILTDKFPNIKVINQINKQKYLKYYDTSVDAIDVPKELTGIRTLFSSFHHFKPSVAAGILKNAADKNIPIAVFEGAGKSIFEFISFLILFPLGVFFITPFIRPFKWSRIIFTYLIPILPFFIYWDGLVSILRMYTVNDLLKLTKTFENTFNWKAGKIKGKSGTVTYLTGIPT
jgi:hypothetical protein